MSGLAALLAGDRDPGVYRWHSAQMAHSTAQVEHAAHLAGWHFGYVDGWTHQDKASVLRALAETLKFPDYFGGNLDALVDSLRSLGGPTMLLWDGWGNLARADQRTFTAIREILQERARREPALTVLLRGEGPTLDVPALEPG